MLNNQPAACRFITGDLIAILVFAGIVALLWLPFGFNIGFFADDWILFRDADQGIVANPALLRPLVGLPFALGYRLSSASFAGFNVVLAVTLFAKALFAYLLAKQLLRQQSPAFFIAVLVLVIPADQALFNLGTVHIHIALAMYLFAAWLLLASYRTKNLLLVVPMGAALVLCIGVYEAGYPLIFVTPVLLWLYQGTKRQLALYTGLWLLVPVLGIARIAALYLSLPQAFAYQEGIFAGLPSLAEGVSAVWTVYRRILLDSWIGYSARFDNVGMVSGLAAGVLVLSAGFMLAKNVLPLRRKEVIVGIAVGLSIVFLGYIPYIVTTLRLSADRTYVFASIGAAVVIGLLIHSVLSVRHPGMIASALFLGLLAFSGVSHLVDQHARYVQASEAQLQLLRNIVQQAPHLSSGSAILIFDDSPDREAGAVFANISAYLDAAVQIVYRDKTIHAAFCHPGDYWGTLREQCQFTPEGISISFADTPVWFWSYHEVIALQYTTSENLSLLTSADALANGVDLTSDYAPEHRIAAENGLTSRAVTMLGMRQEDTRNSP
jgi:hypothetical protein